MTNEEFIQSIALEGEEWRDVVGYEGYYMVSSLGRVLSVARTIICTNGRLFPKPFCLMKLNMTKHNGIIYPYIFLHKGTAHKSIAVHRLVATAFIPNPDNYSEVDHIDRNSTNNNVSNLRWCSHSGNMLNEGTSLLNSIAQPKRTAKMIKKMSKSVVQLKDGTFVHIYPTIADAQREGHSAGAITSVCKGKRKSHHGYQWMYLSDYESLTNKSKNTLPAPITADYPQ